MNIPIILNEISDTGKLPCNLNTIVPNILQRIPIPRPLTKINGEIVAHFTGTNADQQSQYDEGGTSNEAPYTLPEQGITSTQIPDSNNGQVEISVVPSVTTLVETATVQVNSAPPQPTSLDGSNFGGPGGDLSDEQDNNAPEADQMSSAYPVRRTGIVSIVGAGCIWLLGMILH
jgi:hypothetical protein